MKSLKNRKRDGLTQTEFNKLPFESALNSASLDENQLVLATWEAGNQYAPPMSNEDEKPQELLLGMWDPISYLASFIRLIKLNEITPIPNITPVLG